MALHSCPSWPCPICRDPLGVFAATEHMQSLLARFARDLSRSVYADPPEPHHEELTPEPWTPETD